MTPYTLYKHGFLGSQDALFAHVYSLINEIQVTTNVTFVCIPLVSSHNSITNIFLCSGCHSLTYNGHFFHAQLINERAKVANIAGCAFL